MIARPAAALGLLLAALTLSGCGSASGDPVPSEPPAPVSSPSAPEPEASPSDEGGIALGGEELPPGWPEGLPVYEGGRIVSAVVTDDGVNVNAVWATDASPDEAWQSMDAALRDAGFVTVAEAGGESMLVEDETLRSDDYVRDGFEVNVVVVTGEETSVLLNASRV